MSLFQKYRPIDFSSLVGQSFIREALTQSLIQSKTVGAYLFCGSRGTGKTSVARILAKAFNCLNLQTDGNPCGNCDHCLAFAQDRMLDVVEIDAASNTGVDNIREMIERAQFQPNSGKYKVYIIDEVHMLSKGAFNALLKTLEEPPSHVKFILATTEIHKIPDTIISRTQRYDFRKHTEADIVARLQFVADSEGIEAEPRALALVARLARGGLRDALSLFEQYSIGGALKEHFIAENLSLVGEDFLSHLTDVLVANDAVQALQILEELKTRSIEPRRFFEEYVFFLREKLVESIKTARFDILWKIFTAFNAAFPRLKDFPDSFLLLEFVVLSLVGRGTGGLPDSVVLQKSAKTAEVVTEKVTPLKTKENDAPTKSEIPKAQGVATSDEKSVPIEKIDFSFPRLIDHIKKIPKTWVLLAALKGGGFKIKNDALTIICRNDFEHAKLDTAETKALLAGSVFEIFGLKVVVDFVVDKLPQKSTLKADEVADIF